jgi:hypothetical protein
MPWDFDMSDPRVTTDRDDNAYLWDRSGPVDQDVAALERALQPLAIDPALYPLDLPSTAPRWRSRARPWLAAAAAAVMLGAAAAGYLWWRLQWPANRAWPVELAAGTSDVLAVGRPLSVDRGGASIDIGRLGSLHAAAGAQLRLDVTSSARHRVALTKGAVDVALWAPPGRFAIRTPAGEVIDLGCVFSLSVSDTGATSLSVRSGWVQLNNPSGEMLVPAGASSHMRAGSRPLVPVYDDATEAFRLAIRSIEAAAGRPGAADFAIVDRDARARDVLTLLHLALRSDGGMRSRLLARAAVLHPPSGNAPAAAQMDDAAIWRWRDTLPLPPPKNWWVNWRDLFRSPAAPQPR